uniref:T-complex protein 1 subunit eta n=1 Tax=Tetraselmis sp. GSL018 TaxID=582737 RepID=A0A061R0E0_9CHLO|mmetsp:Transcript_33707/g.80004  ORF Transcript_33707/g.80004 Transcript_33707/m.80004 type:complete len:563 (-) Transcript_33707:191-1879(-)
MMPHMMQPQVILLREGTDTSQGKAQLISNINACMAVVDTVRTTLGPRGMDKLIHDSKGTTISNDGATIMKLLEIVHPAAKSLVDISLSQDSEVGDGTTTVVLLAGEFLKEAKPFIEDGVHPQNIIKAYRQASLLAANRVKELAEPISAKDVAERNELLRKCASTSLNSKLVSGEKEFFSKMVVDAVSKLDPETLDLKMIGIKKAQGGGLRDSFLVDGVAFKKTFSYAGFEQQPKKFFNPKILLLNIELELKAERDNAEIRLSDPAQYQSIVDAEWNIIYDKLAKCVESGAKIVLSRLAIGDLATQYFADRDIFCAGRVTEEDVRRVSSATGAVMQTTVNNMDPSVLGTCEVFEEKQVGADRYNLFTGCPKARSCTMVLRGGSEQFIDEAERSLHDAIMIVRRAMKNASIVPGGGAIDLEISSFLREHARSIPGKSQLFINAFAKAMETIPRQLCDNAGFDATGVLNKLRQKHAMPNGAGRNFGVDISTGGVADMYASYVWEPAVVKINAITSASEAACLVLSVDETVRNPRSEGAEQGMAAGGGRGRMGGRGRGRGRGMRRR